MTEQVTEPKNNIDGDVTGNQPDGKTPPPKGSEGKPDGETSHPQKTQGDSAAQRIIPEKYDLKMPKESYLDESVVDNLAEWAKKNNLTNAEAQAVLERENGLRAAIVKGHQEELDNSAASWLEESKSDGEIGGDNFNETVALAKRVVDKFATPALIKALNESGLGNHPEVIRVFKRIGEHLKDDGLVLANSDLGKQERNLEDIFYGDSNKKDNNKE